MITQGIDTFFDTIKNGDWHNIDELANHLTISKIKLKELSRFLSDCGIIRYERENQRIKMQPLWKLLLPKQETNNKYVKPTLANLIISPHGSVDVQSTHISNMSNIEIELTLRIDKKIKEIAINL